MRWRHAQRLSRRLSTAPARASAAHTAGAAPLGDLARLIAGGAEAEGAAAGARSRSRVAVVGGGIVGCSAALHLASHHVGGAAVTLFEQHAVSSGATSHAAGSVSQRRLTELHAHLVGQSIDHFRAWGDSVGWRQVGSVNVVHRDTGMQGIEEQAERLTKWGVQCALLSADECASRYPLVDAATIAGGLYLPNDGVVDPISACYAFLAGARDAGAEIRQHTPVLDFVTARDGDHSRVTHVVTRGGEHVEVDFVVVTSGMWSRRLLRDTVVATGDGAPVSIPTGLIRHQYSICPSIPGMCSGLPVFRFLDSAVYVRPDSGPAAWIGQFEAEAADNEGYEIDSLPQDLPYLLLSQDMDRAIEALSEAERVAPSFGQATYDHSVSGLEGFSLDINPLVGVPHGAPKNLVVATGFNSHGIMFSGGIGYCVAELVMRMLRNHPRPMEGLDEMDIARFPAALANDTAACEREARAVYGRGYAQSGSNNDTSNESP